MSEIMVADGIDIRRIGIDLVFVPADNVDIHALDFYRALGGVAAPVTIFEFGPPTA